MACLRGVCTAALAGIALAGAAEATCQPIRVLLIRPEVGAAAPAEALRTFKQAILDSGGDVGFVATIAEASDLIEFTGYQWGFDSHLGVTQTWRFCFRPLDHPGDLPAGRARPGNFALTVPGATLEEGMRASEQMLRERFHKLLARFEPVVPR